MDVRPAQQEDAAGLASLIKAMGYEIAPAEIAERLSSLPDDHEVFVAEVDSVLAGWAHVYVDHTLIVARRAQLGGLAVADGWHGRGVGSALMNAAETWARERRCVSMWIRSGSDRTEAHDFYRRRGFVNRKEQAVLVKDLT